MEEFPNPCCRCGFCCLSTMCPIGEALYGKQKWCPALSFDGFVATCAIADYLVPIGDGCCIKARAYKDGKEYDFASLPPELKRRAVRDLLRR